MKLRTAITELAVEMTVQEQVGTKIHYLLFRNSSPRGQFRLINVRRTLAREGTWEDFVV